MPHPIRTARWSLALLALVAQSFGCGAFSSDNGGAPGGGGSSDRLTSCDGRDRASCVNEVTVGDAFGCAALGDGTVWCWGRNDQSQLGYSTTDLCVEDVGGGNTQSVACHTFPYQVQGAGHAVHVVAGGAHACALGDDGAVRCWGANQQGQLGNGATLPSMRPVAVAGVAHATQVALGARHGCALVQGGAVYCWGANDRGQVGSGASSTSMCDAPEGRVACQTTAVAVPGVSDAVAIGAGDAHTCALTRSGAVWCWGDDRYGEAGDGTPGDTATGRAARVLVSGRAMDDARSLAVGAAHACALRGNGAVVCWGRADQGAVGPVPDGPMPDGCAGACAPTASAIAGIVPMVESDAGADPDAGATSGDDAGVDPTSGDDASVDVMTGGPADSGYRPTTGGDAGARADGGSRDGGARADGSSGPAPLTVVGLTAGATFSCARLSDHTVRCWGSDESGQLGDGTGSSMPRAMALVIAGPGAAPTNPLQDVADLAAGGATACARLADHTLRCWGSNRDGALGVGGTDVRTGPVPVGW